MLAKRIIRIEDGVFGHKVQQVFYPAVKFKSVVKGLARLYVHERKPGGRVGTRIEMGVANGQFHRTVKPPREVESHAYAIDGVADGIGAGYFRCKELRNFLRTIAGVFTLVQIHEGHAGQYFQAVDKSPFGVEGESPRHGMPIEVVVQDEVRIGEEVADDLVGEVRIERARVESDEAVVVSNLGGIVQLDVPRLFRTKFIFDDYPSGPGKGGVVFREKIDDAETIAPAKAQRVVLVQSILRTETRGEDTSMVVVVIPSQTTQQREFGSGLHLILHEESGEQGVHGVVVIFAAGSDGVVV